MVSNHRTRTLPLLMYCKTFTENLSASGRIFVLSGNDARRRRLVELTVYGRISASDFAVTTPELVAGPSSYQTISLNLAHRT